MIPISCISKGVSQKVKSGIYEVAELGIKKAEEIESQGGLTKEDTKVINLAKTHAKAMKAFADSLRTCE